MTIRELIISKAFVGHSNSENKSTTSAQNFCDTHNLIKSAEEFKYYVKLKKLKLKR